MQAKAGSWVCRVNALLTCSLTQAEIPKYPSKGPCGGLAEAQSCLGPSHPAVPAASTPEPPNAVPRGVGSTLEGQVGLQKWLQRTWKTNPWEERKMQILQLALAFCQPSLCLTCPEDLQLPAPRIHPRGAPFQAKQAQRRIPSSQSRFSGKAPILWKSTGGTSWPALTRVWTESLCGSGFGAPLGASPGEQPEIPSILFHPISFLSRFLHFDFFS